MSLFAELKRRNVFKVGIAYLVVGWLLLQIADVVLNNVSAPGWVFSVIMLVIGLAFPIVLIFAWAFEMTPEGIKREHEVDRTQSITHQTGKKLNTTILVVMALAIAYLLFDKFSGGGAQTEDVPASTPAVEVAAAPSAQEADPTPDSGAESSRLSIAVLPFENRSNREEDQFFTDGIHDDLLTTIAKIGSMKVISRTSVMEYKGTTKKIPEIAAELGVANILEGGIQRSGNQVRINVQLIDAQTDEHLWAEIFDRELTAENLFSIQSEISNAIATALEATLTPEEKQRINTMPTQNLAAFEAYARGKQSMSTRRVADLEASTREFFKAVELDPGFALAWVGVADSHYLLAIYRNESQAGTIALRQEAVEKALAINPGIGEAHTALATVHEYFDRYDETEAAYLKAIELSPNYATAYHWYGNSIDDPLQSRKKLDLALRAQELDPRSEIINASLAQNYRNQGLFSRAEQLLLKVIELYPEFPGAYHALGDHQIWNTGHYAEALDNFQKLGALDPSNLDALRHQAEIFIEIGDMESAANIQQEIIDLNPEHFFPGLIDAYVGLSKGNDAAVREAVNWTVSRTQDQDWVIHNLAYLRLIVGDITGARELYLRTNPAWLEPAGWESLVKGNPENSCIFSWILLQSGDPELGKQLLEKTTVFLEQDLPAAIEHADRRLPELCFLTAGETEKALATLETQLRHGHFFQWELAHRLPMYDLIRMEPRYLDLMEKRELRIDEQRQLVEEMKAGAGP